MDNARRSAWILAQQQRTVETGVNTADLLGRPFSGKLETAQICCHGQIYFGSWQGMLPVFVIPKLSLYTNLITSHISFIWWSWIITSRQHVTKLYTNLHLSFFSRSVHLSIHQMSIPCNGPNQWESPPAFSCSGDENVKVQGAISNFTCRWESEEGCNHFPSPSRSNDIPHFQSIDR